jgi:hypothetical protein
LQLVQQVIDEHGQRDERQADEQYLPEVAHGAQQDFARTLRARRVVRHRRLQQEEQERREPREQRRQRELPRRRDARREEPVDREEQRAVERGEDGERPPIPQQLARRAADGRECVFEHLPFPSGDFGF